MTTEGTFKDSVTARHEIVQLINGNISAVSVIAEHVEFSNDEVYTLISELVEEGILKGSFTQDGLRFYRSDIKMPSISEEPIEEEQKSNPLLMIPKAIIVTGIALFIAGEVFVRIFEESTLLRNTAAGLVFLGLFAIFGGLFSFSKFEKRG